MNSHALLLTGLIAFTPVTFGQEGNRYPLEMVEDGDTVTIRIDGEVKRLQLAGIDAPEDVSNPKLHKDLERTGLTPEALLALGEAATNHLKHLVSPGEMVRIVGDLTSRDRYGRIPVMLYKGEDALNAAMVTDGYARVLVPAVSGEPFGAEWIARQQQAQREGRGLWGSHPAEFLGWNGQSSPQ